MSIKKFNYKSPVFTAFIFIVAIAIIGSASLYYNDTHFKRLNPIKTLNSISKEGKQTINIEASSKNGHYTYNGSDVPIFVLNNRDKTEITFKNNLNENTSFKIDKSLVAADSKEEIYKELKPGKKETIKLDKTKNGMMFLHPNIKKHEKQIKNGLTGLVYFQNSNFIINNDNIPVIIKEGKNNKLTLNDQKLNKVANHYKYLMVNVLNSSTKHKYNLHLKTKFYITSIDGERKNDQSLHNKHVLQPGERLEMVIPVKKQSTDFLMVNNQKLLEILSSKILKDNSIAFKEYVKHDKSHLNNH